MDVIVKKSYIDGSVTVPPSKSVAHRKMIGAALAGGTIDVDYGSKDIAATARCLKILASHISEFSDTQRLSIDNDTEPDNQIACVLNAGESGSTLRFLLPVVCALGGSFVFDGEGRLKDRPIDGLIRTLGEHGAKFKRLYEDRQLPLKVEGELAAGDYVIDGSVSSQYVTGLLFALPLLDGDSNIIIDGDLVSANYVDITLGVLADFGIDVVKTDRGYFVRGNQKYVMPSDKSVEGDWSSAGFILALGVLAGKTRIGGLNLNSLQGDKIVVDLLRNAGGKIYEKDGSIVAEKSELAALDFDAQNCPDTVPVMATVLSFASGVSHIRNVDRLRDKESDRLSAVRSMLGGFGVKTEYCDNVLTIYGGEHRPCVANGFDDHRMAMSAIVCALCTDGESVVKGVECIDKSYPTFIKEVRTLGADIRLIRQV